MRSFPPNLAPQRLLRRAQTSATNLANSLTIQIVERLFSSPPLTSARPAEPLPGLVGNFAFRAGSTAAPSFAEAPDWADLAHTDAGRPAHRHGWFSALAHPQASPDLAQKTMVAWVRQDIPGQGPAWEHPSDAAARLIHWHVGLSFLGGSASSNLREALAGSVFWHLQHLERRLPSPPTDPNHPEYFQGLRRILHFCGMIVGGYTFPEVPGARSAAASGLTGLRYELSQQLFPDGSDRSYAPRWLSEVLWAVLIARACTRAQGAPFPAEADACLARGARYLMALAGELGALPPGDAPQALVQTEHPLAWSLWDACLALGLEEGEPSPGATHDPRLSWLGLSPPVGSFTSPAGKNWALWSFRDGGVCTAWMRIKNQPSRFISYSGSDLSVAWDIGTHSVLVRTSNPVACAHVSRARVDGKKTRIEGQGNLDPGQWSRDLLLNQARLICTDTLDTPLPIVWQVGPGWTIVGDASERTLKHPSGMTLIIQLASELSWTCQETPEGIRFTSSLSSPGISVVSSFEIR